MVGCRPRQYRRNALRNTAAALENITEMYALAYGGH